MIKIFGCFPIENQNLLRSSKSFIEKYNHSVSKEILLFYVVKRTTQDYTKTHKVEFLSLARTLS